MAKNQELYYTEEGRVLTRTSSGTMGNSGLEGSVITAIIVTNTDTTNQHSCEVFGITFVVPSAGGSATGNYNVLGLLNINYIKIPADVAISASGFGTFGEGISSISVVLEDY